MRFSAYESGNPGLVSRTNAGGVARRRDVGCVNHCRYAFPIALSIDRGAWSPNRVVSIQSISDCASVEHGQSLLSTLTKKRRAAS